jgi:hypothetical protein
LKYLPTTNTTLHTAIYKLFHVPHKPYYIFYGGFPLNVSVTSVVGHTKYYLGDKIKEKMGEICGVCEEKKNAYEMLVQKPEDTT